MLGSDHHLLMAPLIYNTTPFAQQCFLLTDQHGQLFFTAVICATFAFDENGEPYPCEEQLDVPAGDEPFGNPGCSSLRRDSAATPLKPAVDLIVNGTAYAPGGKPTKEMVAGIRIGAWSKVLSVTGDRDWAGPLRNRPSSPKPFMSMPIRYERSFGGTLIRDNGEIDAYFPQNPVGVGYKRATSFMSDVATEIPNIEVPGARIAAYGDNVEVAGVGVVARNWNPRSSYVGSYDERWLKQRWPLLPTDIDPRYHLCAPVDQQFSLPMAGELTLIKNLTPDGSWYFRIPSLDIQIHVLLADSAMQDRVRVDTILIDAEKKLVSLIGRFCLHEVRKLGLVRMLVFGTPSKGWLLAQLKKKHYLGHSEPGMG